METSVFCSLDFEATHKWENCDIAEVDYLRYEHRHVFRIIGHIAVNHGDRDIEFIQLKHQIYDYLLEQYPDHKFGGRSCEMIAVELINRFNLTKCSVSEDNENGAEVIA